MIRDLSKTWLDDPKLLHDVARRAQKKQSSRDAENKAYLRAYWDRPVLGRGVDYSRPYRELAVFEHLREQYGNNLTAEVVDAALSILCREMAAKVSPKGADFDLAQGCKAASRLIDGVFENCDFLSVATDCARDGMTADIGPAVGVIDREQEEIRIERRAPGDVWWVDDGTDNPRTLGTTTAVPRDKLRADYPKLWAEIKDKPAWSPKPIVGVDLPASSDALDGNSVRVDEAWCRALGEKAPGRHTIVCGDVVLEDEEWVHEITPVFRFRWSPDYRGYGGRSLARIIGKYDAANRRLMRMVYAGLAGAVPWLIYQEDEELEISDVEYQRVPYKTQPPQVVIPQAVSPQIIEQLKENRTLAFSEGGVNQGMATGNAPARYTSGAAQREYVDIANTRLLLAQKSWERFWDDAAKVVVMLAQQARKVHVKVEGADYYESVSWPRLAKDKYRVSFGLASGLSLTPAGRKQDLADLKDMGLIDTAEVARSLGLPDTQEIANRLNAPRELVMRQVSKALDHNVFEMPSAMQGADQLQALVKVAGEEWQRARLQGNYPAANMECLRRLWKAAQARIQPPPSPPPANDNGAPMGAPAPAPMPDPNAPPPAPMDPNAVPPPAPMPPPAAAVA